MDNIYYKTTEMSESTPEYFNFAIDDLKYFWFDSLKEMWDYIEENFNEEEKLIHIIDTINDKETIISRRK